MSLLEMMSEFLQWLDDLLMKLAVIILTVVFGGITMIAALGLLLALLG